MEKQVDKEQSETKQEQNDDPEWAAAKIVLSSNCASDARTHVAAAVREHDPRGRHALWPWTLANFPRDACAHTDLMHQQTMT
jgi:hypothetical protein